MMLGVVLASAGMLTGCNGTVNYNGRHVVAEYPLVIGTPLRVTFDAKAERRYTAGIQVTFAGRGDDEIEAKLPLVAVIDDGSGNVKTAGFLDPTAPPTTLVHRDRRAERLIGPYPAPSDRKVNLSVDLSDDPKSTEIAQVRVILYDDAKPRSLVIGFSVAALGVLTFFFGGVLVLVGGGRRRSRKK